ncbi:unnamed protein product [Rhizophagus irregularis]|nr:unnamed protein product [Rhizophagus irregularis]
MKFTYEKPNDDDMARLINSSCCKNTGLIEQVDSKDELENQLYHFIHAIKKQDGSDYHTSLLNNCFHSINHHLNKKSTLLKPINLLNKEEYYKLWKVYNAKVKNLASNGEHKGAKRFTEKELLQIINHPTMSVNNSIAQKEKLYIPNIPEIINMYELYFSKYPTQMNLMDNSITRNIAKFSTITLKGNFITAKSLINDKSEIINLTDDINKSNSTCQPLQDLNIVQEKPKQRLEELISKLTADKVFINFVVIFNNSGESN